MTQVTPCPSGFWRGPQFTGLNFTTDFKNTCTKRLSWAPFLPSLQQRQGFSLSNPAPVKTRAKVTLGSKWNPWGIILLLTSDHSEPRTPPYTTLGPPLSWGFRGPSSYQQGQTAGSPCPIPSPSSSALGTWPAQPIFSPGLIFILPEPISSRVHTCSNHPAPGPKYLSLRTRELGTTPTHWTTISLYSLSPLVHLALPAWAPTSPLCSFSVELPACSLTRSVRPLGLSSSTCVS